MPSSKPRPRLSQPPRSLSRLRWSPRLRRPLHRRLLRRSRPQSLRSNCWTS
nr:MAG TPA: hypothetical protein [Caudoviricetes sp.]